MRRAVQFDDHFGPRAKEIDDVRANNLLSTKPRTEKLLIPQ
jgi:hypothetical protein